MTIPHAVADEMAGALEEALETLREMGPLAGHLLIARVERAFQELLERGAVPALPR